MVRLDAARESEGTGLGLALVRAVADRHTAELELSSNKPSGLRVSLNFTKM
jgi:signal transduction histidine kinase